MSGDFVEPIVPEARVQTGKRKNADAPVSVNEKASWAMWTNIQSTGGLT
jgi:hypothetical protein